MSKYALDADLLREAIEDDGLSRSTLKIMARMKTLEPTPEILDWAKAVMARRMAQLTTGTAGKPGEQQ